MMLSFLTGELRPERDVKLAQEAFLLGTLYVFVTRRKEDVEENHQMKTLLKPDVTNMKETTTV